MISLLLESVIVLQVDRPGTLVIFRRE